MESTKDSNQHESQPIAKQAVMGSFNTPVKRLFDMLFQNLTPTRKQLAALKRFQREEQKIIAKAIHFGWLDESDHTGIDFFYDKEFNGGKRICPDCKQGLLRLERPGKEGCSFC
jgi:hypothetical protein